MNRAPISACLFAIRTAGASGVRGVRGGAGGGSSPVWRLWAACKARAREREDARAMRGFTFWPAASGATGLCQGDTGWVNAGGRGNTGTAAATIRRRARWQMRSRGPQGRLGSKVGRPSVRGGRRAARRAQGPAGRLGDRRFLDRGARQMGVAATGTCLEMGG